MNRLKEFLKVNHLRQIDLAEYLGVSRSYMSQAVSGWARLSQDKLLQIIENDKWDTSMFDKQEEPPRTTAPEILILRERIKYLEQLLEEKERLINILLKKGNLSPGCPSENDSEAQSTEI